MNSKPCPFISVIIPVYNDPKRLQICLEALENQTYSQQLYEVIVVDNNSDQEPEVVEIVEAFRQANMTYEITPGSYAARNRGLTIAKGEVIAFTDADCIPAQNWLEKGVEYLLKTPNCGLVAGRVEIFFQQKSQPNSVELYESITAFPQEKLIRETHGGATANLFSYKKVFDKVGLFNPNLKSNGDLEWGQRVYACSYSQFYSHDTVVAHPARNSWKQLYQRTIRLTAGYYHRQCQNLVSTMQRDKLFWIMFLQNSIPPLFFIINTFKNSKIVGLQSKLQVCLVMFAVRYITAWELLRLRMGREAARI